MGNPIPSQVRAIDPYSSYDSNNVNMHTRIVTAGGDGLLYPSPIEVTKISSTSVKAAEGNCVKDDVFIGIQDILIDMTDADFYIDSSGGVWNETGYYYLVLAYEYEKTQPAPVASVGVIKPSQRLTVYDSTAHLFLACIVVTAGPVVDSIMTYDPDYPTHRRVLYGLPTTVVGSGVSITYVSTNYVASCSDDTLVVINASQITLPLASSCNAILKIIKGDVAGTDVTIVRAGSDTIDGETSIVFSNQYDKVSLLPDAVNNVWYEI